MADFTLPTRKLRRAFKLTRADLRRAPAWPAKKIAKKLVPRKAFAAVTLNSGESNYRHSADAEGRRGACAAVTILPPTLDTGTH